MKKSKPQNLERKRPIFFQLGLIVALATTLCAFEWMNYSYADLPSEFQLDVDYMPDVLIPATKLKSPVVEKVNKPQQSAAIINVTTGPTTPDPNASKKFFKDPDLVRVGGDDYDPTDDDPDDFDLDMDVMKVQFKPYYESCTNVLDREQQANCSYAMIRDHVSKQITYPRICLESGIEGTVWVTFSVDKKGFVRDVEVLRGVHTLMDDAAVKAVESVPRLIPAVHAGKNVGVKFKIPVAFKRG
jgi:protein TonB